MITDKELLKKQKQSFLVLVAMYFFYYGAEYFINIYLNLIFRNEFKFSMTTLGVLAAIGPVIAMFSQPFWGTKTDRAKTKNKVLCMLLFCAPVAYLCFNFIYPLVGSVWAAVACFILTGVIYFFFQPIPSLLNTISLEYVNTTKWDFSFLRSVGSFGYSFMALAMSIILTFIDIPAKHTVFFFSALLFITFAFGLFSPKVKGHQYQESNDKNAAPQKKYSFFTVFKIPTLKYMYIFGALSSIAGGLTYTFFSIYFTETIGATSSQLNLYSFIAAFGEIPLMLLAGKFANKFSFRTYLAISTISNSLKLVFFVLFKNPIAILCISPLQGISSAVGVYCNVAYINNNTPKALKASAQTTWGLISLSLSRASSVIGGIIADTFSMEAGYLLSAALTVLFFVIMFKFLPKGKNVPNPDAEKYLENI